MKYSIITKTAAFILAVLTLSASILTFVVTALYSDFIDPYYDSEYSDVMLYALRNDANQISQLLYIKSEIDEGTGISAEYEQEYDRLLEKYGDADSTNVRWVISDSDGANVIGGNTDSFPNFYNSYVITMNNSSYSLSFEIKEMNIDELIYSLGDDDFISCSTSRDNYSAETVEDEVTTYMDDTAYETDAEDGSEYIDYTDKAYAYEAYLAGFDSWYYPLEYIDFYLENYEEWYFGTDIPFADENGNTSVLVISDGGRTEYYVPTIDTVLCTMEISGYIFTYSTATDTWNYESVLPEYLGLTDDEVLYVWIDENLSVKDDYYLIYSDILSPIESFADSLALPVILSCLVISILLFVYCAAVSGVAENTVRDEDGTTHRVRCPRTAWINRIPFDVFFVLCALISCVGIIPILMTADGEIHPTATLIYITGNAPLVYTVSFLCVFAVVAAAAVIILSIIARVRNGSLIKNNAVVIIVRWTAKKIAQAAAFISGTVPLIWQVGAASAIYVLTSLFMILFIIAGNGAAFLLMFLWAIETVAAITYICASALQFKRICRTTEGIIAGKHDLKIETGSLLPPLRSHASCLNELDLAVTAAADEKVRSERLKVELITNVSHDLKTPLTSIISYVDLLKAEPIESERAREYIDVLDRKSQRLKRLTEDLIEASKAQSGNIHYEPTPVGLCQLTEQAVGEYAELLDSAGLSVIRHTPEDEVTIMADGKLLWRVFDNLLSNIVKYSLSKTRVYLDIVKSPSRGEVTVTLKNISAEPPTLSPQDLTERFVRGDASRTTEGSGLGLSIAQSFCEMMGGKLDISVDGDLFRVSLTFPLVEG